MLTKGKSMIARMTTGDPLTAGDLRSLLSEFDDDVQVCIGSDPNAEIETPCYTVRRMEIFNAGTRKLRPVVVLETQRYRLAYDKMLDDIGDDPKEKVLYDGARHV